MSIIASYGIWKNGCPKCEQAKAKLKDFDLTWININVPEEYKEKLNDIMKFLPYAIKATPFFVFEKHLILSESAENPIVPVYQFVQSYLEAKKILEEYK